MRSLVLAVVVAAMPFPAAAQLALFCEIDSRASQGWISPQIAMVIDSAAGTAVVNDLVTMGMTGGPVAGEIAAANSRQTVVAWTVRGKDSRQQSVRASYRATIVMADGAITVSMRPLGYANSFRASGQCDVASP